MAPAGAPIRAVDLGRWLAALVEPRDPAAQLGAAMAARAGVAHCHFTSTGRAGMTVLLRALRRLAPGTRNEVVIPSYTCYSVAASVLKAGLRVRVADISPDTLDFDYERLGQVDFRRVLALVATNLYGLPNRMPQLAALARANGVFLVDDAAQALGASVAGVNCGTWGDAGLYSFDKGKNISAIDGGAIVTGSDDVSSAVAAEMMGLPGTSRGDLAVTLAKLGVYAALLPPSLYWLPNSVPQLGLGRTIYTTEFPVARYAKPLAALALTMMRRLDGFTATRRANAHDLLARLADLSGLQAPVPAPASSPAYVRLPLLASDEATRTALIAALNRAGIGATASYPRAIVDVPELSGEIAPSDRDMPGGRAVAARIVTLPTHPYVTLGDRDVIVGTLRAALQPAAGAVRPAPDRQAGHAW